MAVYFAFDTGTSGTSNFDVIRISNGNNLGNFRVNVQVPLPVEGVLQTVVGARARVGMMFYNRDDGGEIITDVAGGSLPSVINQINLSRPSTNTPLAEALWSATGYFAQQATISGYSSPSGTGPRYASSDYGIINNSDPMNFGTGGPPAGPSARRISSSS